MFSARQGYNDNASDTQSLILRINPITSGSGTPYATWKFYGIGSYIIDWGDGKVQSTSGAATHTYSIADKDYIVRIRNCTGINSGSDYLDRYNLSILEIQQWGTSIWTSLTQAFQLCKNLTTISAIDAPNLSSITNLSFMFNGCTNLTVTNINNWDVSTITNMNYMFAGATTFNQPIGSWNTANVTNMSNMFYQCFAFNQNLNNWNVGSVTDMSQMFEFCHAFNQPLNNWNTAAVTNLAGMCQYADIFNQDISSWNTANVTNMSGMFYACYAFNQPIGTWNVSAVTNMYDMFSGIDLTRPTIFNQDISNWNLRSAGVYMANMLAWNTGLTSSTYSQILIGWKNKVVANGGPNTVTFTANLTNYNSSAVVARTYLTSTAHWTITDAGLV